MHKLFAFRYVVAYFLLAGCQTMASAAGHPNSDTRNWQAYRVQVDGKFVEFKIPPGESKEYPVFSIPQKIDLEGPNVFDETGDGPDILRRFWDYRASRFVGVDGTLDAIIGLNHSEHPLVRIEDFKSAIEEASQKFVEKMLEEEGAPRASNPPIRYQVITISGKEWLRVDYKLSGTYYVTTIDQHNYLKVSSRASGFTRVDWRADAQAAADAILHSIRIVPAR